MAKIPVSEFRHILRLFERELYFQNQSGCCAGITLTQCHALMELPETGSITMNELAKRLSLDKSTVSRTVDNLVQSKMVDRKIPASNRRTTLVRLTDNGRSVCKVINDDNNEYYRKALGAIPARKRDEFLEVFEKLTAEMVKLNKYVKPC